MLYKNIENTICGTLLCFMLCFERSAEHKCKKEDLVPLKTIGFLCPLMEHSIIVPLESPLIKDPVERAPIRTTVNMAGENDQNAREKQDLKRYNLWSRDMSALYPVCKLPSYQFPF